MATMDIAAKEWGIITMVFTPMCYCARSTIWKKDQAWKLQQTNEIRTALAEESDELHAFFDKTDILVARPKKGTTCRLDFSAKGGHNNESHNHNDIGAAWRLIDNTHIELTSG